MTDDERTEQARKVFSKFKPFTGDDLPFGKTDPDPKPETRPCVVCGEDLVITRRFEQVGEPIFGPGNRGYWTHDIHCGRCGLRYQHLPKGKDDDGTVQKDVLS